MSERREEEENGTNCVGRGEKRENKVKCKRKETEVSEEMREDVDEENLPACLEDSMERSEQIDERKPEKREDSMERSEQVDTQIDERKLEKKEGASRLRFLHSCFQE